jgi:hypothetical protein
VGTLGARNAVTRYRNTCHADVIEGVVAAVRAYDGFPTSLEVLVCQRATAKLAQRRARGSDDSLQ